MKKVTFSYVILILIPFLITAKPNSTTSLCENTENYDPTFSLGSTPDDLEVALYEDYEGAIHEWYVLSSPNDDEGPYTALSSMTTVGGGLKIIDTNILDGIFYTVVHKLIVDGEEFCAAREYMVDEAFGDRPYQKNNQEDNCSFVDEYFPDGAEDLGYDFSPDSAGTIDVMAYPNPAKDNLKVKINSKMMSNTIELEVIDSTGKVLVSRAESINSGNEKIFYIENFKNFGSGIYFVKVSSKRASQTLKVIKN